MSRCFRFPPPGYEQQAREASLNLLSKERHKEKKHKKEKKEKDKDRKDKDKERHKDKRRDKKDKHREKKRDRDKDKDKVKPETGRGEGGVEHGKISDSIALGELARTTKSQISQQADQISNSSALGELARRTTGGQISQHADQNNNSSALGELARRTTWAQISQQADQINSSGALGELARRTTEGAVGGSQMFDNFNISDKKGIIERITLENKATNGADRRVRDPDRAEKRDNWIQKRDGILCKDTHSILGNDRGRHEAYVSSLKKVENKDQGNLAPAVKEDKEREKNKAKIGRQEIVWNKDVKTEGGGNRANREYGGFRGSRTGEDVSSNLSVKTLLKERERNICPAENFKKRKALENGFRNENDTRPSKVPAPALRVENGRKADVSHVSVSCALGKEPSPSCKKAGTSKIGANGVIEADQPSVILKAKDIAALQHKPEACSVKPPHPDLKYLSKVYEVPKMNEWLELECDQEWLFQQDNQAKTEPTAGGKTSPIWAEAKQMESLDFCALPYVIPY